MKGLVYVAVVPEAARVLQKYLIRITIRINEYSHNKEKSNSYA